MATRFHAYHLNGKEFAMSYAHGNAFLLVGAHYHELFKKQLRREMKIMNVCTISSLFIPEWSEEYCGDGTLLGLLLKELCPTHIIIPRWDSQKQFVVRCKSHIEQYQNEKKYADVQFLFGENKDQPSISNNNVTFLSINKQTDGHIIAHRFESHGIWMSIDLFDHNFDDERIKSDLVVFPSFINDEIQRMEDAARRLMANVKIMYSDFYTGRGFFGWLRRNGLYYNVKNSDVIVMREDSGKAVAYNMDSDKRDIINKKEYIPY